jgi:hypothetical protein
MSVTDPTILSMIRGLPQDVSSKQIRPDGVTDEYARSSLETRSL